MDELDKEGWELSPSTDKNRFLSMEIVRLPDGAVGLHQAGYIKEILAEFNMEKAKPQVPPHDSGKKHTKADEPKTETVSRLQWAFRGD